MKSCIRLVGFILCISIVLALLSVSFENEYWSLRADVQQRSQTDAHIASSTVPDESSALLPEQVADEVVRDEQVAKQRAQHARRQQHAHTQQQQTQVPSAQEASTTDARVNGELILEPTEEATDAQKPEATVEPNISEPSSLQNTAENTPDAKERREYHTNSARRTRAKTFLVVFMGHSGSTAFITELQTHSEFVVEKLEPLDHHEYARNTDLAYEYAKELMDRGIEKGKIPGFKIRPYHILNKPELWRKFVRDYDCRVIWQYRENIVKRAIGEYRNRYLNDSSVVEGLLPNQKACEAGSDQKCTFRIEDMRFLHSIMNSMSSSDELLSSAVRSLERNEDMSIVKYEDYLYRRERTMKETFDFLGVDWQETAAQRKKASPDNLCKMVTNFQEVCDRFLPCQLWRPFLYDDVNDCRCGAGDWKNFDASFCKRDA